MDEEINISERPASFWNKVYLAVVINTIVVIFLLWAFGEYFS
jgi:hypothetical protein